MRGITRAQIARHGLPGARVARRCCCLAFAAWAGLAGCEPAQSPGESAAPTPPPEPGWFVEITDAVGLDFTHASGVAGEYLLPEAVGSGGTLFDYDDDGDLDVYLVDSGSLKPGAPARPNRLFRHEPDGSLHEVTGESGLGDTGYGMGVAIGDLDNDGDRDVFVTNYGEDRLYRNEGDGTFVDITGAAGIEGSAFSTSAIFFDYDGDGLLDLYVATYVESLLKACADTAGRIEYCGPATFRGQPDILYHNEGDGRFADVSEAAGIAAVATKGLGVVSADFNADGHPDLFVANDGEKNDLWINRDDGTFENRAVAMGMAFNAFGKPEASMGIALGDVDGDLQLDVFLTHLARETNTIYRSLGAVGMQDHTALSGLGPDSLPFTGFGTGFADIDHDGDLDLLVANGRVTRGPALTRPTDVPSAAPELLQSY